MRIIPNKMTQPPPSQLFHSFNHFNEYFINGLKKHIEKGNISSFILAYANATNDPDIFNALKPQLEYAFQQINQNMTTLSTQCNADDLIVINNITQLGFDHIDSREVRNLNPWFLQYNILRTLRPVRNSGKAVSNIQQPFNPDGFNFNLEFMQKECLWRGELLNREVSLLYNKYPFVNYHCLLVPEPKQNLNQFLDFKNHQFIYETCCQLAKTMPNIGLAYNSFGAFASVNHLHFHLYLDEPAFAVQAKEFTHNGGSKNYPLSCIRFTNFQESWKTIESLHQQNLSFNLLYTPDAIYCIPRRFQNSYQQPDWTSGFAWYECCGKFTFADYEDFQSMTQERIIETMMSLKIEALC